MAILWRNKILNSGMKSLETTLDVYYDSLYYRPFLENRLGQEILTSLQNDRWEVRTAKETSEQRIPINGMGSFVHISFLLFPFLDSLQSSIQIYFFYPSFPFLFYLSFVRPFNISKYVVCFFDWFRCFFLEYELQSLTRNENNRPWILIQITEI